MRDFFHLVSRSWLALFGAFLTTSSALLFLVLFAIDLVAKHGTNAYSGLISFVLVPAVFLFGLVLMPIGVAIRRRRDAKLVKAGTPVPGALVLDFNKPRVVKIVGLVFALSIVNVSILAAAGYKGLEVMESPEFCGNACHSVMEPEHTAYLRSAHSRVKCVECHVGDGASSLVKSKINGSWQLISLALDLVPRPIPTPVHNLRPARETCEQCHQPEKFTGDKLKVMPRFDVDDEHQAESKTVMLMKIGGLRDGKAHGIHWHVDPNHTIRYESDPTRHTIYDVEVASADGTKKLFRTDAKPAAGALTTSRTMDCIDCHNRPTHEYRTAEREVDDALASGAIDKELPWVKRESLRLLQAPYASHDAAKVGLRTGLLAFYAEKYPEVAKEQPAKLDAAANALFEAYRQNVFPQMKVAWDSYPSFLQHEPGCFRCHDNDHRTEDGKAIGKSCSTCHEVLAEKEKAPEILDILYP